MAKKEFLIIAIATLITVIAWVVFDIIHRVSVVKLPPNIEKIIEPIETNFNVSNL